ncbi:hypothetical protein HDU99_008697, partial [Rhizoclosmatium hyalinum]
SLDAVAASRTPSVSTSPVVAVGELQPDTSTAMVVDETVKQESSDPSVKDVKLESSEKQAASEPKTDPPKTDS